MAKFDALSNNLLEQVNQGLADIETGNSVLLADESGTSVRDIDKALKAIVADDDSDADEDVKALAVSSANAYEVYRKAVADARNAYRTIVLGEEQQNDADVDKDALKEKRKLVMEAISFLTSYAKGIGNIELEKHVAAIQVPQVGRLGSSSVGQKKPRVYVKIEGTVYDSFSQAAAALSDAENKVTAGQLAEVWNEAGGTEGEFTFGETLIGVTFKPKKSAA